jgi:hypothetical protein
MEENDVTPFFKLKIMIWIILGINGTMIITALYFTFQLISMMRFNQQKIMLLTIVYIDLALILRVVHYSGYQLSFY